MVQPEHSTPYTGQRKKAMNKQLKTLEALLADANGNLFMNNARKMSGYLKSMSLLSDAMARRCSQQFELEVIEELRDMHGQQAEGLSAKENLAKRELELSDLSVKVSEFLAEVDSGCFVSKEHAASSLRVIADAIEAKDSALFPKPWTEEDCKAYAESIGASYSKVESVEELLASVRAKGKRAVKPMKAHAPGRR